MTPYIRWTVQWLLLIGVLLFFGWSLSCARAVPYSECQGDPICEQKAIKREDIRFKREQLELKRLACTLPDMWDMGTQICRSMDLWISP